MLYPTFIDYMADVIAISIDVVYFQSDVLVAGTLYHRANTICSDQALLHEEEEHLFKALRRCKYPIWAINRAKLKSQNPDRTKHRRTNNQRGPNNTNKQNLFMIVPYHQGLSERVKKTCKKFWGAGLL